MFLLTVSRVTIEGVLASDREPLLGPVAVHGEWEVAPAHSFRSSVISTSASTWSLTPAG